MATIECEDCNYNGDAVLLDSGVYICPICGEEATEYEVTYRL